MPVKVRLKRRFASRRGIRVVLRGQRDAGDQGEQVGDGDARGEGGGGLSDQWLMRPR